MTTRLTLWLAAAAAVIGGAAIAGDSPLEPPLAGCGAPPELTAIGPTLTRVAARIEGGQPLTIVAIGSSSTQGVGASAPGLSYPSRLEAELKKRFPDIAIRVINRGKGGEEAPQMLARLDRDVVAEHPDLVVWQLGTNAVLRHIDVTDEEEVIERGLARLKESGSDVVLMDLQYAPRVLARPAYTEMERLLADTAKRHRIGLFHRFAIMRHWQGADPPDAPKMIGTDGLHMTDRGYFCLAADLADAVAANWRAYRIAAERSATPRLARLGAPDRPPAPPDGRAP